ncbi:hypothetical protein DNFV4_02403 [Nitrospira tepida]|uniref:Uncharacterized protein n=2 Tax=Nitrospira tepida TaxID=2973512 RepID=A0AA86T4L1_9BACT|nr:hypothetical protein DNFV4_02403 [Nitrospira tepida]
MKMGKMKIGLMGIEERVGMRGCSWVHALTAIGLLAFAFPCGAQVSPAPSPTPAPSTPSLQPALQPVVTGAGGITPSAQPAPAPTVGTTGSSSDRKSFGTVGQGLPGMPGGPPLTSPNGAQDPSSKYMRPLVIGPLFCDPALDIPC